MAGFAWQRVERAEVRGRTVTLKVKYADFTIITRSHTGTGWVTDEHHFRAIGQGLLDRLIPVRKGIRLLGLGLHALSEGDGAAPQQLGLEI